MVDLELREAPDASPTTTLISLWLSEADMPWG